MSALPSGRLFRGGCLVAVLALHAGVLLAFSPGLPASRPVTVAPVMEALLMEDTPSPPRPQPVVAPLPEPVPVERPKPRKAKPQARIEPSRPVETASAEAVAAPSPSPSPAGAAPHQAPVPPAPAVQPQPAVISCRVPAYPSASKQAGEAGIVLLRLLVDVDGDVTDRQVERSSGFPRLDEAALAALSKCRFQPGSRDGRREATWVQLRYVWKLDGLAGSSR